MLIDFKKLVIIGNVIWDGYLYECYVFMVYVMFGVGGVIEYLNFIII